MSATDLKYILDTDSVLFVLYFCFFFISVCCCILRLFFSLSTATNIYLLGSILRITRLDRLPPLSFVVLFLRTHSKCTIILTKTIFFSSSFRYTYKCIVSYSYSQIVFYSNNLCSERIVTDSDPSRCIYLYEHYASFKPFFFTSLMWL